MTAMATAKLTIRKEKMPTQVYYNINNLTDPNSDPKQNIVVGKADKNRVNHQRVKLSKSPTGTKSREFLTVVSKVANLGNRPRIVNHPLKSLTKFATKADSVQNIDQGLIDDALTVMDVDIGTSESYRIIASPENIKTYTGLGLSIDNPLEH